MLNNFTGVDYFIVAVIALSLLISLWRGFLKEAISLAAWIAAFIVAFLFVEDGVAYLTQYIGVPSVRIIVAFGGLFLATLFMGGLVNLIVAQLVQRAPLSATDRMLGVFFGLLRGVAIVSILVLLAGLTPLPQDPWWDQSSLLPYFQRTALWLRGFLPPELAEHIQFS